MAESRTRLDIASLALLVVGLVFAVVSVLLISHGATPLIIIPSVSAFLLGARNLTKQEAVHDLPANEHDHD